LLLKAAEIRTACPPKRSQEGLRAAKEPLPHGQFGSWLQANFEMSEPTYLRFMRAGEAFGKNVNLTDFKPSVVYALADPGNA
jgi:hypothetical protein